MVDAQGIKASEGHVRACAGGVAACAIACRKRRAVRPHRATAHERENYAATRSAMMILAAL
jgi:hypothetical protein